LFGIATANKSALPYKRKDYLLTQAERSLFGVLNEVVKHRYFIFAKVRLADLVWLPNRTESRQSHFNRVQSKHIDFAICDRASIRPLLCVELDDASHGQVSIQTRDAFVDAALVAAGLPFIRIRAAKAYNVAELRRQIEAAVNQMA
jgi:very-short-patch-repair endonuclease